MGEPVLCECGAVLVNEVDEWGVVTVDGEYIRFKRRTDYIACSSCFRMVAARDILPPTPEPEQPIDRIERLLTDGSGDPEPSEG